MRSRIIWTMLALGAVLVVIAADYYGLGVNKIPGQAAG